MIRITSKQDGFRRAGMAHSKAPREYPNDRFSKEQLAALKSEPMLIVEVIDLPVRLPVRSTQTGSTQTGEPAARSGKQGKGKKQ